MQALETGGLPDNITAVSLDIDIYEDEDLLRAHTERHNFTWRFARATPDMVRELGDTFGQSVLNPPNEPVFIITPDGDIRLLRFGHKSVEDLQRELGLP